MMAVPLLVLFAPNRQDKSPTSGQTSEPTTPATAVDLRSLLAIGFTPTMWLYYLLIASYVALELSIGAWMMEYLQKQHAFSVDQSSRYLSAFFVMLMLGRLAGAWIVEKVDYLWAVAIALLASGFCVAGGLFFGPRYLLCLPLSGLCMSIIFPTVTASFSRQQTNPSSAAIGLLFGFSGLGGALGPWLVGVVSQQFGVASGLSVTLAFNLVAVVALVVLKIRLTRN